jgi:hypothetical protein
MRMMSSHPAVVVIFLLVFARWLEVFTGWSDAIVLPVVALVGTVMIDRLVMRAGDRLTAREWAANGTVVLGAAALLALLSR